MQATLAFIAALNLTRPHVAGLSLGACVALKIAADHAESIGKVPAPCCPGAQKWGRPCCFPCADERQVACTSCSAIWAAHRGIILAATAIHLKRLFRTDSVLPSRPCCWPVA